MSTSSPDPAGAVAVEAYLASLMVRGEERQHDARTLCTLMGEITGEQPVMWADSVVGFGAAHYHPDGNGAADSALASFSSGDKHLGIHLVGHFDTFDADDLARLGPHTTKGSWLHVRRLADVDLDALRRLVDRSVRMRRQLQEQTAELDHPVAAHDGQ